MTESRFYLAESAWEKTPDGEHAIEWIIKDRERKVKLKVDLEPEDIILGEVWSLEDATAIVDAMNSIASIHKLESVNASLNSELLATRTERDSLLEKAIVRERDAMKWRLQEFEVRMRRANKMLEDAQKVLNPETD